MSPFIVTGCGISGKAQTEASAISNSARAVTFLSLPPMFNKKSKRRIRIRRVDALSSLRLAPLVAENEKTNIF